MYKILLFGLLMPGIGVLFAQNNNCATATQVCNDVSFSGNSTGPGVQELPNNNTIDGCLTVEHQSSWYYFQPVTSGTVELLIQTTVDYDFAIWTGGCSNLGSPVRCSYASTAGNTGLAATYYGQTSALGCGTLGLSPCFGNIPVTDVSEGTSGDKYVMPLNVTAGQTYIMLIDNFTANSTPFTLDWTFSNGATLNCNPFNLPVELTGFTGNYDPERQLNVLEWSTASERDNDFFTLERSSDGINWKVVDQQDGAGTTSQLHLYSYDDAAFESGRVNYYRLSQTDLNGLAETFDIISTDNRNSEKRILKVLNSLGQAISSDSRGLVIVIYEDGSSERLFRH